MNLQKSLSQINSVLDIQKLKTKEKIKKIKKHNFLKGMIKNYILALNESKMQMYF